VLSCISPVVLGQVNYFLACLASMYSSTIVSFRENFGKAAQIECEGNNDEKFMPLIERFKGVFKDASGSFYFG